MDFINKIPDYAPYIQTVGTIIAALISAYALIKVNRANISDKIPRSQWAFEMYVNFTGTYLVSEHNADDYKKYKGFYFLFYAYADDQIRNYLRHIDKLIRKNKMQKAEKELLKLVDIYYKKFRLRKYSNRSKISIAEQKKKMDMIFKTDLNKDDFEL